jgi:hypothetical protein
MKTLTACYLPYLQYQPRLIDRLGAILFSQLKHINFNAANRQQGIGREVQVTIIKLSIPKATIKGRLMMSGNTTLSQSALVRFITMPNNMDGLGIKAKTSHRKPPRA